MKIKKGSENRIKKLKRKISRKDKNNINYYKTKLKLDRDINAAENIAFEGVKIYMKGLV